MSDFRFTFGEKKDKDGTGVIQIKKKNRVPQGIINIGTPFQFSYDNNNVDYGLNDSKGIKISLGDGSYTPDKTSADITLATDTIVLKKFEVKDNVKINGDDIIFKNKDETILRIFNDTNKTDFDYYNLINSNKTFDIYDVNRIYVSSNRWINVLEKPVNFYDTNLNIINGDISYNSYGNISYSDKTNNNTEYFLSSDITQNKITFTINKYNTISFTIPKKHLIFTNNDNKYILKRWNELSNFVFNTYDATKYSDLSGNIILRTWAELNHHVKAFMFTRANNINIEYLNIGFKNRSINLYRHPFDIDSFQLDKIQTTLLDIEIFNEAYNEKDTPLTSNEPLSALSWIKVAYPKNTPNIYYIQNVDVYKINPYITLNVEGLKNVRIGNISFLNNYEYTYETKTADIYINNSILPQNKLLNVFEIKNNLDVKEYTINEKLTLLNKTLIFKNNFDNTNYSRLNNVDCSKVEHNNVTKFNFNDLKDSGEQGDDTHSSTLFYSKSDAEYYCKNQYLSDSSGIFFKFNKTDNLNYIHELKKTSIKTRFYDVSKNIFGNFKNRYEKENILPNNPILIKDKSDITSFVSNLDSIYIKLYENKTLKNVLNIIDSSFIEQNSIKFYYDKYCLDKNIDDIDNNFKFNYEGIFGISGSYNGNDISGWIKNTEGSKLLWNNITKGPDYNVLNYDISFSLNNPNLAFLPENTDLSGMSIGTLNTGLETFNFLNENINPDLFTVNKLFHVTNNLVTKDTLNNLKKTDYSVTLYDNNGIPIKTIKDRITLMSTNGLILWSDIYDTNIIEFYENKYENSVNKPDTTRKMINLLHTNCWGKLYYYFDGENLIKNTDGVYFKNNTNIYDYNNWIVLKETKNNTNLFYYFRNILDSELVFFNKDVYEKGRLDLKGVDIYEKIQGSRNDPKRNTAESLDDLIVNNNLPNKFMYHNMLEKPLPLKITATSQTDRIIINWENHKQYGTSVPLNNNGNNDVNGYLYIPIINDIYIEYMPVSRNYNDNELIQNGWWDNIGSYSVNKNKKEIPKKILVGGKNLKNSSNNFIDIILFQNINQINNEWISQNLDKDFDICGQDGNSSESYIGQKIKLSNMGSSSLINPTMLDFRGFYDKSLFILGDTITSNQIDIYSISGTKSWETSRKAFDGSDNPSETYSTNFVISIGDIITDVDGRFFTFKVNNRWYRNQETDIARKILVNNNNPDGIINMRTLLRFYYLSTSLTLDLQNKSNTQQELSKVMTNKVILYTISTTSTDYEINQDRSISENNEVIFHGRGEIEVDKNKVMSDVFHPNDPNVKLISAISTNNRLDSFGNTVGDYVPIESGKQYAIRVYIDNNDPESEQNYSNIVVISTSLTGKPTPPGQLYGSDQYSNPTLQLIKSNNNEPVLKTIFKTPADNDDANIIINGEIKPGANPDINTIPEINKSNIPFIDYYMSKIYESFNFSNSWTPPKNEFPYKQNEGESIFNSINDFYDKKVLIGCNIEKLDDLDKFSKINGLIVYSARKIFPIAVSNVGNDNSTFKHLLNDNYQIKIHSSPINTSIFTIKRWYDISLNHITSINGNNFLELTDDIDGYKYIQNYSTHETRYTIPDNSYNDSQSGLQMNVFNYKEDAIHYAYTGTIHTDISSNDTRFSYYHWIVLKDGDNYFYFNNKSNKKILLSSGEIKDIDNYLVNNIRNILVFEEKIHAEDYLKQPLSIPTDVNRIDNFKINSYDNEITYYPMFTHPWSETDTTINVINENISLLNKTDPYYVNDILDFKMKLITSKNLDSKYIKLTQIDSEIISKNNFIITDQSGINKTTGALTINDNLKVIYKNNIRYIKNTLYYNENYWLTIKYNEENYIFNSKTEANGSEFVIDQTNNIITFSNAISQQCVVSGGTPSAPFIIGSGNYELPVNWTNNDDIILTKGPIILTINNKYRHYFINKNDFLNHVGINHPNIYINSILDKISGLNVLSYDLIPPSSTPSQNIQENNFKNIPLFTKNSKENVIFNVFENREKVAEFVNTKGANTNDFKTDELIYKFNYWIVITQTTDSKISYYYFENTPSNKYGIIQNTDIARIGSLSNTAGSLVEQNNGLLLSTIDASYNIYRSKILDNKINNISFKLNVIAKNQSNFTESVHKDTLTENLSSLNVNNLEIMPPSKPLGWSGKNDVSNCLFLDLDDMSGNWNIKYKHIGIEKNTIFDSTTNDYEIPIYKNYKQLQNKEHLYQDISFYKSNNSIPNLENTNGQYYTNDINGKIYIFDNSKNARLFAEESQDICDNINPFVKYNITGIQSDSSGMITNYNTNNWLVYKKMNTTDNSANFYYFQNKTLLSSNNKTTSRVYNVNWDNNGNKDSITETKIYDGSNNIYNNVKIENIIKIENAHDYIYIKNISRPGNRFLNDTNIDISWSEPEYSSAHYNNSKNLTKNELSCQYYRIYRNQVRWPTNKINNNNTWLQGIDISSDNGWENGELYEYRFVDN